jgi:transcriptional antiterminator NusG
MMMQHNKFDGVRIGEPRGERLDDRMKRIRAEMLHAATMKAGDDSPWFAVRVMTGREISVKNSLVDENIEAVVPMRMGPEYRRRGRVIPAKSMPAMTGYVLVRFMPSDEAFLGIRSVDYVVDMLGGCASPHRVSNKEVSRFMALADEGGLDWERPTVIFRRAEKVKISEGPFSGFHGEIITCRNDGKGDAVVEINLFSSLTPVLMPLAMLEKV